MEWLKLFEEYYKNNFNSIKIFIIVKFKFLKLFEEYFNNHFKSIKIFIINLFLTFNII